MLRTLVKPISTTLVQTKQYSTNANQIFKNSCYSTINYKINGNLSVQHAVEKFSEYDIGCLVVVNDIGSFIGIFSEGDFIKRVAAIGGKNSISIKIKEVCTPSSNVLIAKPNDTLEDCMGKMRFKNIRHLPLVTDKEIKGLISIKDLYEATIKQNKEMIYRLSDFKLGKGAYFGSE